ncbi:autotransporter domain-containing protein [Sphingomicrobium sediminis]|uniref:Autotransporter domain-containing protein n=1 Tax=Sphingomicrobium sediminis TaxID=2950949 RepID=A0A9X2J501_9SPHN|nr:autotransporter domain-containing protein [Sphingomicrobium sediminis]MCM8557742.1 autotransporter domain-containing protein [Sphingomicrobium sediminis]
MTKKKLLGATLLGAAATMALPQAAHAQRVDRIVAFGDSYADDGNFFELVGLDPVDTLVYPTGRFSGGTNYIDTLGILLDAPIDNFAIGGALTDNTNTNGPPLGFATEYGAFLSGGGGAFPTVNGTFDENDLLAISIGGNDARFYQTQGGDFAGAASAAVASAAQAEFGLDLLVDAGARNISFLAGNTAEIPEVAGQPNPLEAAAIRNEYSTTFNAEIRQVLAGYAANGVMVHYLDLSAVNQSISANFSEFGLVGAVCPIFPDTTCAADPAEAAKYLFYGDALHLTSAGFDIVAQYVATQLQAPLTLVAPSENALDNARQMGRAVTARMDGSSPRDGGLGEGLNFFVQGDTFSRTTGMTMDSDAYAIENYGVAAGLEYGAGNAMIGLAVRYGMPEAEFLNGAAETESTSLSGSVYGAYALGPVFAQAYVGIGTDDHEIERRGVVDSLGLEGQADGEHFFVGGKIGYLANVGKLRVGPVVAIDHLDVDVDPYTEMGDAALALSVSEAQISSTRGSVGVEVRGDFAGEGIQLRPYGGIMLEKEMSGGPRDFTFSQTASPEIVNSWTVGELDDDIYGRLRAGFSAQIFSSLRLDVSATTTVDKGDGEETAASVGLTLGF